MRLAVFHDFFDKIDGGEKVALTLARRFDADLFTTNLRPDVVERIGAGNLRIHDLGPLASTPLLKQTHASWRFHNARVPDYDAYLFSGSWAHYAGGRHRPGLLYCYTPPRVLYGHRQSMLLDLPSWQRPLLRAWTWLYAHLDRRSVSRISRVVADSENVRRRIRRSYDREANVVYPPVPTQRFGFRELGSFWLSVNRLYPEKRIRLQLDIFRQLPGERLVVAGGWAQGDPSARYAQTLKPPPNVQLLGEVSEADLADLYARCRGLIATARDEDFGLTPLEAMAAGKAVLATREGGYLETVRDGETGWLLPADADAFVAKIQSLDEDDLLAMRRACERRAALFDEERFVVRMRDILEDLVASPFGGAMEAA